MERNDTINTYFLIMWIVYLVLGILMCVTLVGIPLGIPMIIGAAKMNTARKSANEFLLEHRQNLFNWGIFLGIVGVFCLAVFGGVVSLVATILTDSMIKDLEKPANEQVSATEKFEDGANRVGEVVGSFGKSVSDSFSGKKETAPQGNSLKDKLREVEELRKEGLITDREAEERRKKLLGV